VRTASRRASGFSLIELLVGVAVSLVVVAGALTLLSAQRRAFMGSSADRTQQETARMALEEMSQSLRMAGFGIEPPMVFDFGQMTNVPIDRVPLAPGQTVTFGGDAAGATGFACAAPVTCRDRIDGPDEIAFQYRDPNFNHAIVSFPSQSSVTIAGPLNQPIQAGQVFQAVCFTGSMTWAYLRASAPVAATTDAQVSIALEDGSQLDYPHQNRLVDPGTGDTCFRSGQARLLKVERFRYLIQNYDAAGNVVAWNTAGSRPYLMLDRGLRDAQGNAALDVVSPDVEDLQVSYVFPLALPGAQVAGATTGARLGNSDTGIDFAPAGGPPTYATAAISAVRGTRYPANIRAVRLAIVVRQPNPDPERAARDTDIPAAGNRPLLGTGVPGYSRMLFETSVGLPNMESRAPFFPYLGTSGFAVGSDQLNVGGG
jgi:type IV pilus assembly protein PilW